MLGAWCLVLGAWCLLRLRRAFPRQTYPLVRVCNATAYTLACFCSDKLVLNSKKHFGVVCCKRVPMASMAALRPDARVCAGPAHRSTVNLVRPAPTAVARPRARVARHASASADSYPTSTTSTYSAAEQPGRVGTVSTSTAGTAAEGASTAPRGPRASGEVILEDACSFLSAELRQLFTTGVRKASYHHTPFSACRAAAHVHPAVQA